MPVGLSAPSLQCLLLLSSHCHIPYLAPSESMNEPLSARYAKPGEPLEGFVARLQKLTWVPTADGAEGTRLASPCRLRDPAESYCRMLFPSHRFPCTYLQERPAAMAALKRLGLCARVTPHDLEEDVYPKGWAGCDVIDDWTPGDGGHPTMAQIFAGWTLCPQAERWMALAASSKGRLIRGHRCSEVLPARAAVPVAEACAIQGREDEAEDAAAWAGMMLKLGIETVYMEEDFDFSTSAPPQGFMRLTASSLLNVLVRDKATGPDVTVLGGAQKQLLLRYLISPLDDSRQMTPVLPEDTPQASTQAVVLTEDRELARATTIRKICSLPIHRRISLDVDQAVSTGIALPSEQGPSDAQTKDSAEVPGCDVNHGATAGCGSGSKAGEQGHAATLSVQYAALVDLQAEEHEEASDGVSQCGCSTARGHDVGDGDASEEGWSGLECKRLLSFSKDWSLIKESVWSGKDERLPTGALELSTRKFLSLTPGTGWFYRCAGIGTIASLAELYSQLLLSSTGSFSALCPEEQMKVTLSLSLSVSAVSACCGLYLCRFWPNASYLAAIISLERV